MSKELYFYTTCFTGGNSLGTFMCYSYKKYSIERFAEININIVKTVIKILMNKKQEINNENMYDILRTILVDYELHIPNFVLSYEIHGKLSNLHKKQTDNWYHQHLPKELKKKIIKHNRKLKK
jgi:hypothetical protein